MFYCGLASLKKSHPQYSIGGIPVSVQDPAMTSAVMEALALVQAGGG